MPPSKMGTRRILGFIRVAAILSVGVLTAGTVGVLSGDALAPPAASAGWAPVHPGDFPDPSVMEYQGTYYAFATQNFADPPDLVNVQVSTSTNGVNWTASNRDALPHLPSWAVEGDTWAPSVAFNGSEFVMYYTATEASDGDQCIGMATSATPLGPYNDNSNAPVVCQNGSDTGPVDNGNYGGSIDPDIFTDPATGDSWLIWKSDGNHIGVFPTTIWSVPLSSALFLPPSPTPQELLSADETWQGGIVEGPDMVETSSHAYYLFYAGGDEGSAGYAIGWASCPSGPAAPCSDGPPGQNPVLTTAPGMSGPGGPDVFSIGSQLVMAFAAWQGTTIGYLSCGIRPMYLATLSFSGGTSGIPELAPAVNAPPATDPSCPGPTLPPPGYWQVASDGGVFTFGGAQFYGSTGAMKLNQPVVGMAHTPDDGGYWLVAADGGVFAFGDAQFYGSTGNIVLNKPIIGMIPTLDGGGYWLIASDGGVFAFGDARFYGSTGGMNLGYPVTAAAAGYLGAGYWLVDANGQVFNFGDAPNEGQPPFAPGGYTITGMATTHDDDGYWLSSANGNVASFGDAAPHGSMYGAALNGPIVGMAATRDGGGYWLQGSDGGIFCFGDAQFYGSMGGRQLNAPMVGITST
jgi:hypothetical protein